MKKVLRVLHLEDDPDYNKLVRDIFSGGGLEAEIVWVKDQGEFETALGRGGFDLILADYLLPGYTGAQALEFMRERDRETPFLIVSGTIGEHAAIESLRAGATDYVLKQWPEKLMPAVQRAVQEAEERARRGRAESELARSESLFRSVWENSADGLMLRNGEGVIMMVNGAFCGLTGMEPAALEGRPFTVIYADQGHGGAALENYREQFRTRTVQQRAEWHLELVDGRQVIWESTNSFVDLAGQPAVLLSAIRDVTVQRRMEEQLRQSQKMEAVGQLAGGVAHDLNNILTVVQGHASIMLSSGKLEPGSAKSAQSIAQAAKRAADLTRQLLTFSRRQVMEPRRFDLNELVGDLTKTIGAVLGLQITLQLKYLSEPASIEADASMVEQALLNLALNARDAMLTGGQLEIRITRENFDAQRVMRHPESREGNFVCLTVADNGRGIAPEHMRRIFDPFFTTKDTGKGPGLGLATVYGIVKQHQGWIEVGSEPGRGTSFHLYFPAATEPAESRAVTSAESIVRGGDETILVVEDEAPVRDLVCVLLREMGYDVLEAESGVKALEVWKSHKEDVDLLVTDLVMPDRINGRQLADALRNEKPGLKIIFMSGYSADVVGREFVRQSGLNYLQKPYHPHKLLQTVRECLDEK